MEVDDDERQQPQPAGSRLEDKREDKENIERTNLSVYEADTSEDEDDKEAAVEMKAVERGKRKASHGRRIEEREGKKKRRKESGTSSDEAYNADTDIG